MDNLTDRFAGWLKSTYPDVSVLRHDSDHVVIAPQVDLGGAMTSLGLTVRDKARSMGLRVILCNDEWIVI